MKDFAEANGIDINDPIMQYYKDGDLDISKELRIQLAKGLYKKEIFLSRK